MSVRDEETIIPSPLTGAFLNDVISLECVADLPDGVQEPEVRWRYRLEDGGDVEAIDGSVTNSTGQCCSV